MRHSEPRKTDTLTAWLYRAPADGRPVVIPSPAPNELLVNDKTYDLVAGVGTDRIYVERDEVVVND